MNPAELSPRRQGSHLECRTCDHAQGPKRANLQLAQVVAGNVLNDPAAGLHQFARRQRERYPDQEEDSDGEKIIMDLSPRILELLQRNPALVRYLLGP